MLYSLHAVFTVFPSSFGTFPLLFLLCLFFQVAHEAAQWLQHCSAVAASQRQSSLFGGFSLNELPKQARGGVSRQLGRAHLPLALGLTLTQWPGNKGPAAKTWMVRKAGPLLSWLGVLAPQACPLLPCVHLS